jgi:thiamine biosynthesis lipoprotein
MTLHFTIKGRVCRQHLCPFVIALLILYATGCGRVGFRTRPYKASKFLMSTIVEITAVGSRRDCQRAVKLAFGEIKRIDRLMNVYSEDSEVSRINRAAGESAVEVSADTLEVINQSISFARLTDGALDITVAPLMELWGFRDGSERIPLVPAYAGIELKEKLSLVDYRKILVDEDRSTVKLGSPGMRIDVSGIAKGYAVDKAIQVLDDAGIRSALVNAGGDIYALGAPHGKRYWRIGIRHPRRSADLLGILELKDEAVATSGDYEDFFEVDGRRYCHIMNTKTGQPVKGIMSVTIVADSTAKADALATAVFPLGADDGMKLIETLEGVDGIIVTGEKEDDMEILMSSGMKDRIQEEGNREGEKVRR